MKIKRFSGNDMKSAINSVREYWGADAVILSSKRFDDHVEITAAADFDAELVEQMDTASTVDTPTADASTPTKIQSGQHSTVVTTPISKATQTSTATPAEERVVMDKMHRELLILKGLLEGELSQLAWREMGNQSPMRAKLVRRLVGLGLNHQFATNLASGIEVEDNLSVNWRKALAKLALMIQTPDHNILETGGTVAVVGATGVGKTTSVAKLAGLFALKHGRDSVGLVTTDCFRVGGHEQLTTFARILGVPVSLATNREELSNALAKLSNRKLILIDTAGMSQRDIGLSEQFNTLNGAGHDIQVYLTLSAIAQKKITDEVIAVFNKLKPTGSIITKVDEAVSLGGMLGAHIQHRLPVMFYSEGQRIPEDLSIAKPVELVKVAHYLMEKTGWQQSELQRQNPNPINAYAH